MEYEFRLSELVKVINPQSTRFGEIGEIILIDKSRTFPYDMKFGDDSSTYRFRKSDLKSPNKLNSQDKTKLLSERSIGDLHREICEELNDICVRKNKDYGDSFKATMDEFGVISLAIRLNDKMMRLKQLIKAEAEVKDESLKDTLMDMCNYCVLGLIELNKKEEQK
jgi:predicted nucleic acid binding AN1-type Zn finger protein